MKKLILLLALPLAVLAADPAPSLAPQPTPDYQQIATLEQQQLAAEAHLRHQIELQAAIQIQRLQQQIQELADKIAEQQKLIESLTKPKVDISNAKPGETATIPLKK